MVSKASLLGLLRKRRIAVKVFALATLKVSQIAAFELDIFGMGRRVPFRESGDNPRLGISCNQDSAGRIAQLFGRVGREKLLERLEALPSGELRMQQGVGVHRRKVDLGDAGRVRLLGPADHKVPSHWDVATVNRSGDVGAGELALASWVATRKA
jgi:hypothetical protein